MLHLPDPGGFKFGGVTKQIGKEKKRRKDKV